MSELVHSPFSVERKQLFITEPPTTAVGGVPGMWMAPTPPEPSYRTNQIPAPDPGLGDRIKDVLRRFPPPF